jgi:hypothetical protein
MQIYVLLPLLVCLLGVLAYALSTSPKVQELGRLAYACGLLVTLYALATRVLKL